MAKRTKKRVVSKNAKEVAQAMGMDPIYAVEWEFRYGLTNTIIDASKRKGMTVSRIAKKSGTSRARVTKILKGDTQGISIEVLLRVLAAVGKTIKVSYKNEAA